MKIVSLLNIYLLCPRESRKQATHLAIGRFRQCCFVAFHCHWFYSVYWYCAFSRLICVYDPFKFFYAHSILNEHAHEILSMVSKQREFSTVFRGSFPLYNNKFLTKNNNGSNINVKRNAHIYTRNNNNQTQYSWWKWKKKCYRKR